MEDCASWSVVDVLPVNRHMPFNPVSDSTRAPAMMGQGFTHHAVDTHFDRGSSMRWPNPTRVWGLHLLRSIPTWSTCRHLADGSDPGLDWWDWRRNTEQKKITYAARGNVQEEHPGKGRGLSEP